MNPKKVNILGMELDEWKVDSCIGHFGVGNDWATLYDIASKDKNKGHATKLLKAAKKYYQSQKKLVGGTIALNTAMSKIYRKLKIHEFKEV